MTIRWLHLSDTHFREDELWDRRATLRALIAKVAELQDNGLAPTSSRAYRALGGPAP